MIFLGLDEAAKREVIARYVAAHGIKKVFVFHPERFPLALEIGVPHESIEWAEIIMYRTYYRLIQEIGPDALLVVTECQRTQNRHDLTYNCLRNFTYQAGHVLVFQRLPIIDTWEDFAVLFDLTTKSRWKRDKIGPEHVREAKIHVAPIPLDLRPIEVVTDDKVRAAYAKEKRKLIDGIGLRDPHTIPRNLYLMSGKAKLAHVEAGRSYVGRNNRFKLDNMTTYGEATSAGAPHVVFELPHNFLNFVDFLSASRQASLDVLVADLKVDRWYFERYQAWVQRVREAYDTLGRRS